jgi:hypothetical protein
MSNPGSYLDRLQNDACYMESLDVHQVNGDLLKPLTKQKVCIKQANRIRTLCANIKYWERRKRLNLYHYASLSV